MWLRKLFDWLISLLRGDEDGRIANPDPSAIVMPESLSEKIEPIALWYPGAAQSSKMKTQGKYPMEYPEGAVVHYNAGRFEPQGFLDYMRSKWYVTFLIDREGHIWQDFPLDEWGHHAGKSRWKNIDVTVNNRFVGIEVMSAGLLKRDEKTKKYRSWWGDPFPLEEVRCSYDDMNIASGCYHRFTATQVDQLMKLIVWLEKNGQGIFKLENVVGHDEVSPGRKSDPGAAMPYTMPHFRKHLKLLKDN